MRAFYLLTVGLLRDFASVCEREEDFLCGWLRNGAFEVGRDVHCTVWAVYLFFRSAFLRESLYRPTNTLDIIKNFVLRFGRKRSARMYVVGFVYSVPSCPFNTLTFPSVLALGVIVVS